MRTAAHRGALSFLALTIAMGGAALLQAGCLESAPDGETASEELATVVETPGDEIVEPFDPALAAQIARAKLASIKPGEIPPQAAPCGTAGSTATSVRDDDAPSNGAANQRSGSSTGCAAVGVLQPTDDALYFCWTPGTGGTWTYLQNLRTGVRGWVRDDLLDGFGAANRCPGLG